MTVANLLAVLLLAGIFLFFGYYWSVLLPRKGTLDWVALHQSAPLTFQVKRHPMERRDTLPVLLITVIYAFTAFFSLGSTKAPDYRRAVDFWNGATYTIQIQGDAVYADKIWYYPLLGTGEYNLEISADGESWSTLWYTTDEGSDERHYYWADAEGFAPKYALGQNYKQLLKWNQIDPDNPQYIQYIRITGRAERDVLQLGKLVFLDQDDQPIRFSWAMADSAAAPENFDQLFAVDSSVPAQISWRNSAYFDEIYHARTALEQIEGTMLYEWTHPPLGKTIISLGIRLFGMTPFGWRFMGTLFGCLMVPLMYLFLKNIFGKRAVATCGTILLASEFMHLTQTRIATIDTYGVFFVLLSYYFFYRWLTAPATPDKKGKAHEGWLSLALSGIFWGVGCAAKWTVIYAGVGLAVLYLINLVQRVRFWDRSSENAPELRPWLCKTLGLSVLCFVLLPAIIYTLAYLPVARAAGVQDFSLGHSLAGLRDNFPVLIRKLLGSKNPGGFRKDSLTGVMLENQWAMFHYHEDVHAYHPYLSRWYQWLVDERPILYYSQNLGGLTERFASFNNPVVSWAGLLALLTCAGRCVRRTWAKIALLWSGGVLCAGVCWLVGRVENGDFDPALSPKALTQRLIVLGLCLAVYLAAATLIALQTVTRRGGLDVFITVGFAAQFLPWVFINRITFAYHYFPATLFLILALCRAFDDLMESQRAKWKVPVIGLTAASAGLYALFYPALIGLSVPRGYTLNILQFLPDWPM